METWDGGPEDPFENFYHENDVVSGTKDDGDWYCNIYNLMIKFI